MNPFKSLELGEYENWFESERIVGNFARASSDLTGESFDLLEVASCNLLLFIS